MGKKRKLKATNITSSTQINMWFAMATESMKIKDWDGVSKFASRSFCIYPKNRTIVLTLYPIWVTLMPCSKNLELSIRHWAKR